VTVRATGGNGGNGAGRAGSAQAALALIGDERTASSAPAISTSGDVHHTVNVFGGSAGYSSGGMAANAGLQDLLVSAAFTLDRPGGFGFEYALGVTPVPEPQAWVMMALGLAVLLGYASAQGTTSRAIEIPLVWRWLYQARRNA
jgi:hypothetical protein